MQKIRMLKEVQGIVAMVFCKVYTLYQFRSTLSNAVQPGVIVVANAQLRHANASDLRSKLHREMPHDALAKLR